MANIDNFKFAMEKLNQYKSENEQEAQYMSDINNWCILHTTKYLPQRNKNGKMFIPTTAMATNFEIPRATVHTTLNHVVQSWEGTEDWNDMPYVIFMPYNDLVARNQKPLEVSAYDTYFAPNPDSGLTLPDNAYIVRPSNDCLYSIGETEATYKTDNFTEEEIKFIIDNMDEQDRRLYNQYSDVDYLVDHWRVYINDPRSIELFEKSNDKRAFIHGMMEEARMIVLTKCLRNIVVKLAMNERGFKYIRPRSAYDDIVAKSVANTAVNNGLNGDETPKGHWDSLGRTLEMVYSGLHRSLQSIYSCGNDLNKVIDTLNDPTEPFLMHIVDSIVNSKPINVYEFYVEGMINRYKNGIKSISEYSPELDKTFQRNSVVMAKEFMQWLEYIKHEPEYSKFISRLKKMVEEDLQGVIGTYRAQRNSKISGR